MTDYNKGKFYENLAPFNFSLNNEKPKKKDFNKGRPMPSKKPVNAQPVATPPRDAMLKRRSDTFYDVVQKSRELDKRIKQHRLNNKPVNERIADLEEFHKLSQKMEEIDL